MKCDSIDDNLTFGPLLKFFASVAMPSACGNQYRKGNLRHPISRNRFELKLGEVHILFRVNKQYYTLTDRYHFT